VREGKEVPLTPAEVAELDLPTEAELEHMPLCSEHEIAWCIVPAVEG